MKTKDIIEDVIALCAVIFVLSFMVFIFFTSLSFFFDVYNIGVLRWTGFLTVNSLVFGVFLKLIHGVLTTTDDCIER